MVLVWILVGVVVVVAIAFIVYYNRFSVLANRIDNSLSQIDVQLKRRAELVPNLLETVKGYAKHERKIMTEVTEARKALVSAKDMSGKVKAGSVLESALGRLFAIAENYPQLRANENFLELQRELASIEDKIAYSRQYYNDSILSYNTLCTTFPGTMFAGMYGRKEKKYLEIPAEQKSVPKVQFD